MASATVLVLVLVAGCGGGGSGPQPATSTGVAGEPGAHRLTLESGGQERHYLLVVPDSYQPDQPVPLVVVLHPAGGNLQAVRAASRLDALGDDYGALVVYPEARERLWQPPVAGEFGVGVGLGGDSTDVDFLRELVEQLVREWGVAPGQVFATGHSNGAAMTYRLAAEAADLFAAVAPVGGYLFDPLPAITPAEPVSVIAFVGLAADAAAEIADGVATWRNQLGCELGEPEVTGSDPPVTRTPADCPDGSEVVEYAIEEMPHVWPGQAYGIDLPEVLWEFFTAHARPA